MSIVFSSEAACGYPYPDTEAFTTERLESNIDILKIDKVVVFRREFYSWVLSLYYQTLNEKRTWTLEEFILKNSINLLTWKNAAYHIECMCKSKGVKVLLIEHEQLLSEKENVLDQISHFISGSHLSKRMERNKRRNFSRYGTLTIRSYRNLNSAFDNQLGRLVQRAFKTSPRKLIEGKLGEALNAISSRELSGEDVRRLIP